MARNVQVQLSNSEGLGEIIIFAGLSHSIVIHPTIHAEPLLTAQAFYYLEQLESVAHIRYEENEGQLPYEKLEYLIDNYLFAYSKENPESKISSKAIIGKYWEYDPSDMYGFYDGKKTEALILDEGNDDSVLEIKSLDENDKTYFSDWCLIKNYTDWLFVSYVDEMNKLLGKKVHIHVMPNDERDGYMGKARLLKCGFGLLDFYQAHQLSNISIRDIKPGDTAIKILDRAPEALESIPLRRVDLNKEYNPTLLSYYFSGLKEFNPLLSFIGFYNVLEYYFEEAPCQLGKDAEREKDQIKCVIELITTNTEIETFINSMDTKSLTILRSNLKTSSSIEISSFLPSDINKNIDELGRWLYQIRCAVVHSKKTRNGSETAIFKPYTPQAENMALVVPIVKWLAILCIEKDYELGVAGGLQRE